MQPRPLKWKWQGKRLWSVTREEVDGIHQAECTVLTKSQRVWLHKTNKNAFHFLPLRLLHYSFMDSEIWYTHACCQGNSGGQHFTQTDVCHRIACWNICMSTVWVLRFWRCAGPFLNDFLINCDKARWISAVYHRGRKHTILSYLPTQGVPNFDLRHRFSVKCMFRLLGANTAY